MDADLGATLDAEEIGEPAAKKRSKEGSHLIGLSLEHGMKLDIIGSSLQ